MKRASGLTGYMLMWFEISSNILTAYFTLKNLFSQCFAVGKIPHFSNRCLKHEQPFPRTSLNYLLHRLPSRRAFKWYRKSTFPFKKIICFRQQVLKTRTVNSHFRVHHLTIVRYIACIENLWKILLLNVVGCQA